MAQDGVRSLDAAETAAALPYPALVDAVGIAVRDLAAGRIVSPERLALPCGDGVMLSMPCSAPDLAVHKLVTVHPGNAALGLPTIHGQVLALEARTGRPLFVLDGPTVTGRRTAAVTLLAIRRLFAGAPRRVLVIGAGTQARFHVEALAAVLPGAEIAVRARRPHAASRLRVRVPVLDDGPGFRPDVVIAATTSAAPVYGEPPRPDRLVIGIGAFRHDMAEIGPATLAGSAIYVDDPAGARVEAGDLLQAGVDWAQVRGLAEAEESGPAGPAVFKSVGSAAWDLAACRVARQGLDP